MNLRKKEAVVLVKRVLIELFNLIVSLGSLAVALIFMGSSLLHANQGRYDVGAYLLLWSLFIIFTRPFLRID